MTKRILENWLPSALTKMLIDFNDGQKFMRYPTKELLAKNINHKNEGRGKRAFLLATGPSIKNENLKVLAGEDCFSLSNFFLHEDIKTVNPKFHFFPPYHEPLILENYIEWLHKGDQELPTETKIFLGHSVYEIVRECNLFANREVYYLYLSESANSRKVDLTKLVLRPQSGPLMILPVLIYMGYEKIYLLGCDHTVLRDFKKAITHFYNSDKDPRINASDASTWGNIVLEHKASLNVFMQYDFYEKMIEQNENISVINLSSDSWLDTFNFGSLKEVIRNNPD